MSKADVKTNPVIIRVWQPTDSKNNPISYKDAFIEGRNPGHVSIETKEFYSSFWPEKGDIRIVKLESLSDVVPMVSSLFAVAPGRFFSDLRKDELAEAFSSGLPQGVQKKSDVEVILHTLDVNAMKQAFEKFQADIPGWTTVGDSIINRKAGQSCSSLAFNLLMAGGIQKLVGWYDTQIMFVAPSHIATLAIKAKAAEDKLIQASVQAAAQPEEQSQVEIISRL